ncbi:MAG: tetratricopeptide repeat protein [Gammaproteobacteria bacterium]|nr:tetratricopeptide repeat protein [Gammaproteobacteria bacterium]
MLLRTVGWTKEPRNELTDNWKREGDVPTTATAPSHRWARRRELPATSWLIAGLLCPPYEHHKNYSGILSLCLSLLIYTAPTHALDLSALWKNTWYTHDQQGLHLMQQQHYVEAAKTFQDPDWQAAAAYRSGQYEKAAQHYRDRKNDDTSLYNLGNALAKSGHYQEAINAYQQALKLNPSHPDALYNKKLVEDMLKQNPPPPPKENKQDSQDKNQSPSQDKSSSQPNESESSPQSPKKNDANDAQPNSSEPQTPPQKPEQPATPEPSDKPEKQSPPPQQQNAPSPSQSSQEEQQAKKQWLNLVPDHPGGLLRQQFLRDHLKRIRGTTP